MKDIVTDLMNRNDWVILDAETAGLDSHAEAVSVGVIDHTGQVLLDTLIKPTHPIHPSVTAINGVTNDMLSDAPTFLQVLPDLHSAVAGKTIVVYNAPYDHRIISQSFEPYRQTFIQALNPLGPGPRIDSFDLMTDIMTTTWLDVMAPYAEFHGEWNDYYNSYKWQRLTAAAAQMRVPIVAAHRAVGDCQMTLGVIRAVYKIVTENIGLMNADLSNQCYECGKIGITTEGLCSYCWEQDTLHCTVCEKPVGRLHYGLCDDCYRLENPEYLDID